jgi:tRNA1(Val) A37 N6-methylase TrmN6
MESYELDKNELLIRYGTIENVVQELVKLVRAGTIWFPLQKHFRVTDPYKTFDNLKHTATRSAVINYDLRSYFSKYGSYLPALFRGQSLTISLEGQSHEEADILSDYFHEHLRLRARRYDQDRSIMECWEDDACLTTLFRAVLKNDKVTPHTIRETIYTTIAETKAFSPSWARSLIRTVLGPDVAGKKWLDISAGWGDRLLAAMSLDMDYLGYDPNLELQAGYQQMIAMFAGSTQCQVIPAPFEQASIDSEKYDVVLTSPPFFDLEVYTNQAGQSIVSFPTLSEWMVNFMFVALRKAWAGLKIGGYLILHLSDTRELSICEMTNLFIETSLSGSSWEGIIGLQGGSEFYRPTWVWKKVAGQGVKWTPRVVQRVPRKMYSMYPEIHRAYVAYLFGNAAANYKSKRATIKELRKIADKLSLTTVDDLALYSVMEAVQLPGLVAFLKSAVGKSKDEVLALADVSAPNYKVRRDNAYSVRAHVATTEDASKTQDILSDDVQITALLEITTGEKGIAWCRQLVHNS